jgi:hypothetical protein
LRLSRPSAAMPTAPSINPCISAAVEHPMAIPYMAYGLWLPRGPPRLKRFGADCWHTGGDPIRFRLCTAARTTWCGQLATTCNSKHESHTIHATTRDETRCNIYANIDANIDATQTQRRCNTDATTPASFLPSSESSR